MNEEGHNILLLLLLFFLIINILEYVLIYNGALTWRPLLLAFVQCNTCNVYLSLETKLFEALLTLVP